MSYILRRINEIKYTSILAIIIEILRTEFLEENNKILKFATNTASVKVILPAIQKSAIQPLGLNAAGDIIINL